MVSLACRTLVRHADDTAVIHLRCSWETNVQHLATNTELRDMRDTFAISIISVLSDM
jgi:hypothetical protein